jgi:hypothetical protein
MTRKRGCPVRAMLCGLLVLVVGVPASAADETYEGTWVTTNRRLDGTMTCVVTDRGDDKWSGHFSGVWQGRAFSYRVEFSGPPDKLRGTATIDCADYEWTGQIDKDSFRGTFGGTRYVGSFNLKRKGK